MKYNILLFAMSSYNEWERGTVNRNYFVVRELLKHPMVNRMVMVNYLPHTYKRALRVLYDEVCLRLTGASRRPIVVSTVWNLLSPTRFKSELLALYKRFLSSAPLIVWSYYPLEVGYFEVFPEAFKVFDAVDNWLEHPAYQNQRTRLSRNYAYIKDHADLIFTVSEDLKKNLFENKNTVCYVPNGIDLKHFQPVGAGESPLLKHIKRPIVGYVGTIEERIDFDLVRYLAEGNQDKSFVFVGPIWRVGNRHVCSLRKLPNIHFIGKVPYLDVPGILKQFSVAIIPHKITPFTVSMDPMKIYEYLAAGLPVVTTPIFLRNEIRSFIDAAEGYEEFSRMVQNQITAGASPRAVAPLHAFVWKNVVQTMLDKVIEIS